MILIYLGKKTQSWISQDNVGLTKIEQELILRSSEYFLFKKTCHYSRMFKILTMTLNLSFYCKFKFLGYNAIRECLRNMCVSTVVIEL